LAGALYVDAVSASSDGSSFFTLLTLVLIG
jgi:hypothetical protein